MDLDTYRDLTGNLHPMDLIEYVVQSGDNRITRPTYWLGTHRDDHAHYMKHVGRRYERLYKHDEVNHTQLETIIDIIT